MKRACILVSAVSFVFVWSAAADSLKSFVVSSTQSFHIGSDRAIRIINFVQDAASSPRSTVQVTKDGNSVIVMFASLSSERTSASDKDVIVTGPSDVVVTNNAASPNKSYITFKVGND